VAGTPPEDLLEWLTREEEALGTEAVERGTTDIEEARRLLYEELGYEPTESQLDAWMGAGKAKYEVLPEIGVSLLSFERPWGTQYSYYNYATHRFIGKTEAMEAVRTWL